MLNATTSVTLAKISHFGKVTEEVKQLKIRFTS